MPPHLSQPNSLPLPGGGFVSWTLSPEGLQHVLLSVVTPEAPTQPVAGYPQMDQEMEELNTSVRQAFETYLEGQRDSFLVLPLAPLKGTPFQRAVWHALHHIPYAETLSYTALAERIAETGISKSGAVRAVGQALAKNPLPIVLPCHRVLTQSGKLGGYMGARESDAAPALALKRWLLDLESKHRVVITSD